MKTVHKYWKISELIENIGKIEFPEFQREPTVWKLDKKQRLIDSILRDFDISSIYFYRKEGGGYDCIDGRQRINAILSYLGINGADEEDNEFHSKMENEIYDDGGRFSDVDSKRYSAISNTQWGQQIRDYKLNIVEIMEVEDDEELNLLFLRLQIASVLNAGEKLNAMTGDMRDAIFYNIARHPFFQKISIPNRRFAREQVASQIVLNEFSLRDYEAFHRARYVDSQEFFKTFSKFSPEDTQTIQTVKERLDTICYHFGDRLRYINSRAIAVSVYLFAGYLMADKREEQIGQFADFLVIFQRTLKWQLPLGVQMHPAYHRLLKFQTNVNQAAAEKSAIERRHNFLREWFQFYTTTKAMLGDDEYYQTTNKKADDERRNVRL